MPAPRRILSASEGTNAGAFGPTEWTMLVFASVVWGSSFLWIAIGLEGFSPGLVAWIRMALGAAALSALRASRRPVDRSDWPALMVVAVAGNAGPALLFALAEQSVETSVAGMINASVPLFTALIAISIGVRSLRARHGAGLLVGFAGVALLSLENASGPSATIGVLLVLVAVIGYSVANNALVPLQQRYGGTAVIFRAQLASVALLTPFAVPGVGTARGGLAPIGALLILGIVGTGITRTVHANLAGRVGAPRASVIGYLVPVVAVLLGVVFRDETLSGVESWGLVLILTGAYLASRSVRITAGSDEDDLGSLGDLDEVRS